MIKATILLVDNDSGYISGRKELLSQDGYTVCPASTPKNAWEILRQRRIDLVVTDIRLVNEQDDGDDSGLQLAEEIATRQIPTIILTGFAVHHHVAKVLKILQEKSPLKIDLVGKQEGYESLALAIARMLTINPPSSRPIKKEVFVVYGHDRGAKYEVVSFLSKIGIHAIDISAKASQGRTIIQQIKYYANVTFAIALLTPDDLCISKGNKKTRRARQNVIFELGFFIAALGNDRVCSLRKGNVEMPSDFHGVIYKQLDINGAWKTKLVQELNAAGFDIDLKKVVEA